MAKEFFKAHFFPGAARPRGRGSPTASTTTWRSLFFNAFPLPQREAGARQTLRYIGELLERRHLGADLPGRAAVRDRRHRPFRPGIGMIASRLDVPVVPVRLDGLERRAARRLADGAAGPRPRRVRRAVRLVGDDYEALAKQVEDGRHARFRRPPAGPGRVRTSGIRHSIESCARIRCTSQPAMSSSDR